LHADYVCSMLLQPDEYEKLGSYALIGLPDEEYKTK
jgi:hypothetical protein